VASNATVYCYGDQTAGQVEGKWQGRGVTIVAGAMDLQPGAKLTATGLGYQGATGTGNGPGAGTGVNNSSAGGGGGAHGGDGGNPQSSFKGGGAYGSLQQPVDLGSAGGAGFAGVGGAGGGAIRLIVSGLLKLDGGITSDGADGLNNYYGASGGGAGGSIWITVDELTGTGVVAANGAAGPIVWEEDGGGGAGGRIAIEYNRVNWTGTVRAVGGTGFQAGGAGTIFWQYLGQTRATTLLVDNGGVGGALTPVVRPVLTELIVTNQARLILSGDTGSSIGKLNVLENGTLYLGGGVTLAVDDLLVTTNGQVVCQSRDAAAQVGEQWLGRGVIVIAGEITVDEGGKLTANGQGYSGSAGTGNGPGGGTGVNNSSAGGGGGGYGGAGGKPESGFQGGPAYGSALEPIDLGSAGGAGYAGFGGAGGGAIRLIATGSVTINGVLSANGVDGLAQYYGASGGGAGGSIWVSAAKLVGQGEIQANGGLGPGVWEEDGGSGGGGRVALYFADSNEFAGTTTVGSSGSRPGSPGTITTLKGPACVVYPFAGSDNESPVQFFLSFTTPVTGLEAGKLIIGNGAVTAFEGSGRAFDVTVRPQAKGLVTCLVPAGAAQDAEGNPSVASNVGEVSFAEGAPAILSAPRSLIGRVGATVILKVQAVGTDPLEYAWYKNGLPLGATNDTLVLADVAGQDSGSYWVTVSNEAGSVTSLPAWLTILPGFPSPELAAQLQPDGVALELSGVVGRTYLIEAASALGQPTNWTPVVEVTLTSETMVVWRETLAGTVKQKFYRAAAIR
jgi:hypothetical protein